MSKMVVDGIVRDERLERAIAVGPCIDHLCPRGRRAGPLRDSAARDACSITAGSRSRPGGHFLVSGGEFPKAGKAEMRRKSRRLRRGSINVVWLHPR